MDNTTSTKKKGRKWFWTNERHLRFLNSIEASFVRTMFENDGRFLRLDRQLPDCFESTQDLDKERRRRHSTSDVVDYSSASTDNRNKRLSSPDQVLPQFENRIDVSDEKERTG